MRSRLLLALAVAAALVTAVTAAPVGAVATPGMATARGSAAPGIPPAIPGTSSNFQLVGSNPLFNRGMNAAPAAPPRKISRITAAGPTVSRLGCQPGRRGVDMAALRLYDTGQAL